MIAEELGNTFTSDNLSFSEKRNHQQTYNQDHLNTPDSKANFISLNRKAYTPQRKKKS